MHAPAVWLLTDVYYLCAKDNVLFNALFACKALQRLQHPCSANLVECACAQLVVGVPLIQRSICLPLTSAFIRLASAACTLLSCEGF